MHHILENITIWYTFKTYIHTYNKNKQKNQWTYKQMNCLQKKCMCWKSYYLTERNKISVRVIILIHVWKKIDLGCFRGFKLLLFVTLIVTHLLFFLPKKLLTKVFLWLNFHKTRISMGEHIYHLFSIYIYIYIFEW